MKELELKLSSNVMSQTADFLKCRETLKYEILNYDEIKNLPKIEIAEKITISLATQEILNISKNSMIAYYIVTSKQKDASKLTRWYIFEDFTKTENFRENKEIIEKRNNVIKNAPIDVIVEISEE